MALAHDWRSQIEDTDTPNYVELSNEHHALYQTVLVAVGAGRYDFVWSPRVFADEQGFDRMYQQVFNAASHSGARQSPSAAGGPNAPPQAPAQQQ